MELVLYLSSQELNTQLAREGHLFDQTSRTPLYSWNLWEMQGKKIKALKDGVFVVVESSGPSLDIRMERNALGVAEPVLYGTLPAKEIVKILETPVTDRTCILMNTSLIDEPWCFRSLKPYLKADDQVCVLAFSFFDDTKNLSDWNRQYAPGQGIWYKANTDVFRRFGIPERDVHWVNYFTDSTADMLGKILQSNVLLLTGGAPDLMMKRIREKKLKRVLKHYVGTVIGYSAGAMIQLEHYHISPDEDYPTFSWQKGLGYLKGFDIEVHYKGSPNQKRWIEKAQKDRHLDTWAIYEEGGMIVKPDSSMEFFGQVDFIPA